MYRVVNPQGETVAVTSRLEDAQAIVSNQLDGIEFKLEYVR